MKKLIFLLALTPACAMFRPVGEVKAEQFCRNADNSAVKTMFANRAGMYVRCTNGSTLTVEAESK